MKYLVVSDIHGNIHYASKLIDIIEMEKPDKIILLGDLYEHRSHDMTVPSILNTYQDIILCTRGNCDTFHDEYISKFSFEDFINLTIADKNFCFTHGHIYNMNNIPSKVDILIYGHLHTGFIKKSNNIFVINTGSLAYPRKNTDHSYVLIDDQFIYLKDIDTNVIDYILYSEV